MFRVKLVFSAAVLVAGLLFAAPAVAQDGDGDGVFDEFDNCPGDSNPAQRDSDADGAGNACDPTTFPPFTAGPIDASGLVAPGPRACHVYTLRIPPPVGDTLPIGFSGPNSILYKTGIFDNGSTRFLINSRDGGTRGAPDFGLGIADPGVPSQLDARVWGLQAVHPIALGIPINSPQAEVPSIVPRVVTDPSFPTLVGSPIGNGIVTYIDYTIPVSRTFPFFVICNAGAALTFYPDLSEAPSPLFWSNLERFGSTAPGSDGSSTGQRVRLVDMRFANRGLVSEAGTEAEHASIGTIRVLYDTGTTVTQISEEVATALAIDLVADPVDQFLDVGSLVQGCDDPNPLSGYRIDRIEIDADDGTRTYVLENPVVFVRPPCTPGAPPESAFGGGQDAILGSDAFQATQVLIDGPGDRLGLFAGVSGCLSDEECGADGLFCNGEPSCDLATGECQFALPPCPPSVEVCVVRNGFCDEENDRCEDVADDSFCDDGLFCNGVETCDLASDACVAVSSCPPSIPPTVCNEVTDTCDPAGCLSDEECGADGLFCNGEPSCDLATGDCQLALPPCPPSVEVCVVRNGFCDEANDRCVDVAEDSFCDDGLFCNGVESCDLASDACVAVSSCPPSIPPTVCNEVTDNCDPAGCLSDAQCDDGVSCTVDSCDLGTGICSNAPDDGLCGNGLFCDGSETCNAVSGCQMGPDPCRAGETCLEDQDRCDSVPPLNRECLRACLTDIRACLGSSREGLSTCRESCVSERQSALEGCDQATDPRQRSACRRAASAAFHECLRPCQQDRISALDSCSTDFGECKASCRQ